MTDLISGFGSLQNTFIKNIKIVPPASFIEISKNKLNIKRLYKSAEFKDGKTEYNRGDVAEGIQSAALVARFMKEKPNMTVTRNDVENVIKKLGKYKNVNEFTIDSFTSPNAPAGDGTQLDPDQIIYKVGLKSADMKAFLDTRVRYTKMDLSLIHI